MTASNLEPIWAFCRKEEGHEVQDAEQLDAVLDRYDRDARED